jgi:AcrR family transcriptional regulator
VATRRTGLREQKKQATRAALREAALRLALERGPENVRVDDIAEAAGVSARTYNNYFASREHAIVAAVTAEREARVAGAIAAQPAADRLADAVTEAVVEQYTDPGGHDRDALMLIMTRPALRHAFVETAGAIEDPVADAIAQRLGGTETHTARVLAASIAAAIRVALQQGLQPTTPSPTDGGLVVPTGSLPDLLRLALAALAPALDAADDHRRHRGTAPE